MSAEVRGLRRALARVASLPARAREARDEVLDDWKDETRTAAQARAPERTGSLRIAIEDRRFTDAARVGVYKPEQLEYAEYVEKGTSSMEEQPYLVPAFEWTTSRGNIALKLRAAIRRRGLEI